VSAAAKSVFVFAIYLLLLGAAFMIAPHAAVAPLGIEADDIWTRALGIVVATLGYYYLQAARHELTPFFRATILGRFFVLASVATLIVVLHKPPILIVFGVIDAAFGVWTWMTLGSAERRRPAG